MLVHHRVTPNNKFPGTHLYTPGEERHYENVLPKNTTQWGLTGKEEGKGGGGGGVFNTNSTFTSPIKAEVSMMHRA